MWGFDGSFLLNFVLKIYNGKFSEVFQGFYLSLCFDVFQQVWGTGKKMINRMFSCKIRRFKLSALWYIVEMENKKQN